MDDQMDTESAYRVGGGNLWVLSGWTLTRRDKPLACQWLIPSS